MPNETLIHADIFFFISSIALVVISVGLSICIYYVVKILRNVREITDRANEESTEIVADIRQMRRSLRDEGLKWKHVTGLFRNFFARKQKKAKQSADSLKDNK